MTGWAGSLMFLFGLVLGVLLITTKKGGILENRVVYQVLDKVINLFRSAFLGAEMYPIEYNALSIIITALVTLLGVVLFSHTEKTFMDTV